MSLLSGSMDVVASRRTLSCPAVDTDAADKFASAWIEDVKAGGVSPQ